MCKCGKTHEVSLQTLLKQRDALNILMDTGYKPTGHSIEYMLAGINDTIETKVNSIA